MFKLHSVSPRIVHWSLSVVELGERIDPGDKLVHGVAEMLTPTVGDEKDFIFKVEAAPISPSDLGSVGMLAGFVADSIAVGETAFTVTVPFPQAVEGMFKADGDSKPVGNEGAGVVVDAGSAPEAQDLLGKRVAVTGGSSYAQYTKTSLNNPMFAVLLDDVSSLEGASVFVNPLDGAWFHSHNEAGRLQSHRAHCRRIAVGTHVGEAVQGGGYPSCEHRVNCTGKCRGIQRRVH